MTPVLAGLAAAAALLAPMPPLAAAQGSPTAPLAAEASVTLVPGQVWTLKDSRYAGATVVIDKLETVGDTPAAHISVLDVPVRDASGAVVRTTTVMHLPVAEDMVKGSVSQLVTTGEPYADYAQGYDAWQEAKGGVFTLPVSQVLDYVLGLASDADH